MAQQIWEAPAGPATGEVSAPEVDTLDCVLALLGSVDGRVGSSGDADVDPDSVRVEQLGRLERIKAAAAAAQARVTEAFDRSQRAAQEAAGVRSEKVGRGIGDQVALASGLSAAKGSSRVRLARALVTEMPHTLALLGEGSISEWAATLLVRETQCLTREARTFVDERLCGTRRVIGMTPRRVVNAAKALAAELDVAAVVERAAYAERERRVWVRPAPEQMAWVGALVPVAQGVACYAALDRAAAGATASGDPRGRGQLMADMFVERLTGQASAEAVPVEIGLVMTPDLLLGVSDEPARLGDGTPLPAPTARDLARREDAPRWLRRIFTDPVTGVVTDIDRARRRFYGGLEARMIEVRDQHCRHPGCDSLTCDADHVRPAARGGSPPPSTTGSGCARLTTKSKSFPGGPTG